MSIPPVFEDGHDLAQSQGVGQDHEKVGHVYEKHASSLGHVCEKPPQKLGHDPEKGVGHASENTPVSLGHDRS